MWTSKFWLLAVDPRSDKCMQHRARYRWPNVGVVPVPRCRRSGSLQIRGVKQVLGHHLALSTALFWRSCISEDCFTTNFVNIWKRNGTYKFRQYLMGNLIRPDLDYQDNYSTTISSTGTTTFFSLATTTSGKVIH